MNFVLATRLKLNPIINTNYFNSNNTLFQSIQNVNFKHQWYKDASPIFYPLSFKTLQNGKYHIFITDTFGCSSIDSTIVQINSLLSLKLESDMTKCKDEKFCLNADITDGAINGDYKLRWYLNLLNKILLDSVNPMCIKANQSGIYIATYTQIEYGKSCMVSDSINIEVLPTKDIEFTANHSNLKYCFNDSIFLFSSRLPLVLFKNNDYWKTMNQNKIQITDLQTNDKIIGAYKNENACWWYSDILNFNILLKPKKPELTIIEQCIESNIELGINWYKNSKLIAEYSKVYCPIENGIYTVTVIDSQGCRSEPSNAIDFRLLNINVSHLNNFKYYPQPVHNQLNIEISGNGYTLEIFNELGIKTGQNTLIDGKNMIAIDLKPGFYLGKISESNYNEHHFKFIVN